MEYNTARPGLKIPEYGRNVQKMIEHVRSLPTKEERSRAANSIINVMVALNPHLKEQSEYKQKLWDHLFLIANYDLDVDSPYPMPSPQELAAPPKKPAYSSNHIRYRYYGKNIERMIQRASEMPDSPSKDAFVSSIGSYMKMAYKMWNEEKVPDEVIIKHLKELSKGKLSLNEIRDLGVATENVQQMKQRKDMQQNRQHRHKGGSNKKNFRKN